jgi:hypothetical protein
MVGALAAIGERTLLRCIIAAATFGKPSQRS